MKRKIIITILITVLIIPQLTSCLKKSDEGYSANTFALDTVCGITIYGENDNVAQEVISKAFKEITRYEKLLSRTIEGSDVDKINKSCGEEVEVSDEVIEIIEEALNFSDLTKGAFDVSIGKVSSLYNFRDGTSLPSDEEIEKAINHIDFRKIKINGNKVSLLDPDMMIDLGAVAKGYIATKIAEYISSFGIENAVINLGGNIVAIGDKGKDGYTIGIKNPLNEEGGILGTFNGEDITIVTSGTYERYIEVQGKKYHHVLDPKTGYSKDTDLVQASVVTDKNNGAKADCLSTVLLLLGSEEGLEFMENIDYAEAILLTKDGKVICTNENTEFDSWIEE